MRVLSLRVPLRFLRGQYARTALTVVALACGIALICALDLVTRSMQLAFEEVIDTMAGRAALEVTTAGAGRVPEEVAQTLAGVPGVELAVPVVSATAFLADGSGEALLVQGVDVLNESALRIYEARPVEGEAAVDPVPFFANPRSVVLTSSFAARHGLAEGDAIELDTPRGVRAFSILRLLEPRGVARAYGGNLLVMDIVAAQEVFTEPGLVSRIDLVVGRDQSVDVVRGAVERVLPPGLQVTTPAQRKVDLQAVMRSFGVLLRCVGLVGIVIAYLIAFNGLSWEFERRAWQLGVLGAIGARGTVIWWVQMKEAALLGGAGLVLGIALGFALAKVLLPVVATATALNFNLVVPDAELVPSVTSIVIALVLGVGTTLLAAWLPAARAVRLGAAGTIRGKGKEPEPSSGRWSFLVVLGAWVAAAACAVLQGVLGSVALGLSATALVAVATALSATPVLRLMAGRVLDVCRRAGLPVDVRLAALALRDHARRAGMAAATIAVGVAAVVWLAILTRSFEGSVVDTLGRAIRADLVVTSANVAGGFLEAPMGPEVLARVRAIEGVGSVAAWRALEWPYEGAPIGISAYDPAYFVEPRFGAWPLKAGDAQAWQTVADGRGVVVSTSFVATSGKGVGESVVLETPSGPLALPIVGVTVDFVSPRGTIEMSRALYAERWRDPTATRIFVLADGSGTTADLRSRIARQLGDRFQLRVLSAGDLLGYFVSQVRRAFAVIPILAAIVFVVILVGLADSLASSVLDRRRELATSLAIGLRARRVRYVVVLESLMIGCAGLVLALLAGFVLAGMWVGSTFQLLLGWALDLHVPALGLAITALITVLACVLSAVVPARSVQRLPVAEVLRAE